MAGGERDAAIGAVVASAVKAALAEALPAMRQSLLESVAKEGQARVAAAAVVEEKYDTDVPQALPPARVVPVAVLPVREPPAAAAGESRPRGGEERRPQRLESVARNLEGELDEADFEQLKDVMATHAQARAFPKQLAGRSRPLSFLAASFAEEGVVAPRGESDRMLLSLRAMLKPDKEAKPKAFKSFKEWYAKMSEMQLLSKELRDKDPASYWAMDWHFKCTMWVFAEHSWPVAAAYSEQVFAKWDKVAESAAASEECEAGDWAEALHVKTLHTLLLSSKTKTGGGGGGHRGGSKTRTHDSDTWCEHHKMFFLKESGHKTSTCRLAKNQKAAGAGAAQG